jgi:hypothetical protein
VAEREDLEQVPKRAEDVVKMAWPYDAHQDDPLTAMRIPVVGTIFPQWSYLVALCIKEDPDTPLWHGLRPTDDEAQLIQSLIHYERSRYNDGYVKRVLDSRPLDIDGGTNTITLIKRGEGDWGYRRHTWQHGPYLIPDTWQDTEPPLDLIGLFDRIHWVVDAPYRGWVEWKDEHPELFGDAARVEDSEPNRN